MLIPNVLADLDARLDGPLSLVVSSDGDGVGVRRVRLAQNAADVFRAYVRDARERIASGTAIAYTALAELQHAEYFLLDDVPSLAELADLRSSVLGAGDLAAIGPDALQAGIGYYAIGVGRGDDRVAFIRRTDPRLLPKAGRLLAIGHERLESVEDPVFTFSKGFDVAIGRTWAVIFNQVAFERLARETGIVERQVADWVTGITDSLHMDAGSLERLKDTALRDSRTWRRLRDIKRRGHLARVDLGQVVAYARAIGLDERAIVRDGALHFDPKDRFGFLQLLSEDLYRGELTGERFESHRKASME